MEYQFTDLWPAVVGVADLHLELADPGARPSDRGAGRRAGCVHEVAAEFSPGTRVVYVDNDPVVHVHANALLTGSGTGIVLSDLRGYRST